MKPVLFLLCAAFVLGVALYGKNRRSFVIFQAVMLPVFLWFFGADVMLGKGETTSSLWFLPFVLVWIVGTAALGLWALKHLMTKAAD
ncbi:MAG: hypothetical protein QNJ20_08175 [Paracoccaceae bacterium]|nr:hypothetical protein [Paracoccaceae bacterium]